MNIGVIGSGLVGQVLASGCLKHGHSVVLGTRAPDKLAAWAAQNPRGRVAGFAETAAFAEVLMLAMKGSIAADALRLAGSANFVGKVVMDATNPIADGPPVHGVLPFFTTHDDSLMERLQRDFTAARFVKAFSCVGNALMVNPQLQGGKPTMFICGNDEAAKRVVTGILDQFGWETWDMGAVEAARAIEPLCTLWCIPGFRNNDWVHAFKMLKL